MKKLQLRILVATLAGVLFGFICYWISCGTAETLEWPSAVQIILIHTLMGFAIGISLFKWNWILHGIIMGLIFSLPLAFPLAFDGLLAESAEMSSTGIFIGTLILGIVYGFLTELITSVIFKAKKVE